VTSGWLAALPNWLVVGVALGAVVSAGVAGLFVLADRYFPTRSESPTSDSADARRRVEICQYLDAIDERYAEGHPVAGQSVAFYLPERDVAITFDPRAYYRIERTPTHPVLVEHEMPGLALGARLPFETPDVTVGGSEAGREGEETGCGCRTRERADPAVAAYAELGVQAGAPLAEVKAAYRERVKEVHPDQGGDEDEFKRVREAYTTAKKHAG